MTLQNFTKFLSLQHTPKTFLPCRIRSRTTVHECSLLNIIHLSHATAPLYQIYHTQLPLYTRYKTQMSKFCVAVYVYTYIYKGWCDTLLTDLTLLSSVFHMLKPEIKDMPCTSYIYTHTTHTHTHTSHYYIL